MLALGPVVMFAGFFTWPVGDDEFGQAALDSLKDADNNMLYLSGLLAATGVLMIFGGLFLLSQDLMANSGKMERDMLLMSRIGFMFAFTIFYLFFGMSMEANWLVKGEVEHLTADESNTLALDVINLSNHIWGSVPIAWGTALLLFSFSAVRTVAPKEPMEWAYALPAVAGLGMITLYWHQLDAFFFFAIFCAMPIGILMLTGHLEDTGADSDDTAAESEPSGE
tara:strand:- start:144 stop:815 length:672 start_codon:yes stop_codon:yes gene_type:complete